MLVTSNTQSIIDLKEDIADNCNDVLEKFYNEFFDTLTDGNDKIEKLNGYLLTHSLTHSLTQVLLS